MPGPCVKLDGIAKHFGASTAVTDLSFELEEGEVLGLLGPNGAGKSTTLAMIAGLVRPSAGTITIFGRDAAEHRLAIAPRMGVLTENPSFYDHLSVAKNLALLARLSAREITLDRVLAMVGLVPYADQRVGTLSRGLRQRLGLAQAFLTEPELLVLDEPTTALDAEQAAETIEHLRSLSRKAGVTIIFSTHEMDEVEALCDRIAILEVGRLILCDKADAALTYDRNQVDVLLESAEAASKKLTLESWVEEVEVRRGRLRVRLNDASPGQLASFLIKAGYNVNGIVPRRRRLLSLLAAEWIKHSRSPLPYLGLLLISALSAATLFLHPVSRDGASDFDFIAQAVPASLNLAGFLVSTVFAASLIAVEVESGAVRTVLVRPIHRHEFLLAKLAVGMAYAGLLTLVAVGTAWICAIALGELTGISFGDELIFATNEIYGALVLAALFNLPPYFAGVAYALCISTLVRRPVAAVGIAVGSWLLADYLKYPLGIARGLFTTYLDRSWIVFQDRCNAIESPYFPEVLTSSVVSAAWFVTFTAVAVFIFGRRSFGP